MSRRPAPATDLVGWPPPTPAAEGPFGSLTQVNMVFEAGLPMK